MNVETVELPSASVSLWQMLSNQFPRLRIPKQRMPLPSSEATIFLGVQAARQALFWASDRH